MRTVTYAIFDLGFLIVFLGIVSVVRAIMSTYTRAEAPPTERVASQGNPPLGPRAEAPPTERVASQGNPPLGPRAEAPPTERVASQGNPVRPRAGGSKMRGILGVALGLILLYVVYGVGGLLSEIICYETAKAVYETRPRGPNDFSPHAQAQSHCVFPDVAFRWGSRAGTLACFAVFWFLSGWWRFAAGPIVGLGVAAAIGYYLGPT
jgi:hypothetical protein